MWEYLNTVKPLPIVALCAFFLSLTGSLFAQSLTKDEGYHLGIEDVVKISVLAGGEEQVSKDMVVGSDGYVTVPFIGKVKAAGLSLSELEENITMPLGRDFFVDPQVHLQVVGYHSLNFFISGAVKNPGRFELDFTPTLMDLIANAGGVLPERGNLAYILRGLSDAGLTEAELDDTIRSKEPIKIDLNRLLDEGDMTENLQLQSGDTVYIPLGSKLDQAATKVYVQGEVKKPGVFDFQPGLTALSACIMAGGFDKFAAPNRARIVRITPEGQKTIKINLDDVISGDIPDLPLKPGDRIHIPESWL